MTASRIHTLFGVPIHTWADPLIPVLHDIESSGPFGVDVRAEPFMPEGICVRDKSGWVLHPDDFARLKKAASERPFFDSAVDWWKHNKGKGEE